MPIEKVKLGSWEDLVEARAKVALDGAKCERATGKIAQNLLLEKARGDLISRDWEKLEFMFVP